MAKYVTKKMVEQEIIRLIKLALNINTPLEYADRYVYLARRFSMHYKVKIPSAYRIFICKKCKRVLRPGETAVFRLVAKPKKHISIKCLRCGYSYSKVYSPAKSKGR